MIRYLTCAVLESPKLHPKPGFVWVQPCQPDGRPFLDKPASDNTVFQVAESWLRTHGELRAAIQGGAR